MKQNILMIGHFATKKEMRDGQTVKTRHVYQELLNSSNYLIERVDTQNWNKKPVSFLVNMIRKILKSDKIILIVASNGARVIIPILTLCKKIHNVDVCYCPVGSWVDVRIKGNSLLRYCCRKLDLILVETEELVQNLAEMGYNNVKKMYNFKLINKRKTSYEYGHFCTFSRVMKEKGIEEAIYAINLINKKRRKKIYLDIYGPIDKNYKQEFSILMKEQNKYINYKGVVNPEESINYISKYYLLIFPTQYIKEGLPGTLIDTYSSGVPVIASNWNSAKEFVKDSITGFIYEFKNVNDLINKINYALDNKELIENMKNECIKFSDEFLPEKAIKPLKIFLNSENKI